MAPRPGQDKSHAGEPHVVHKHDQSLSMQQRIDGLLESFRNNPASKRRWETETMQSTTCIAASPECGTMVYEIDIKGPFCTILGALHGGTASTILDQLTSFVLYMYAKPGFMENGTITRTLTVTCLRPVLAGTKLRVEAELVSIGKTMSNVNGFIKTNGWGRCALPVLMTRSFYHRSRSYEFFLARITNQFST
jgi:uncharacterized protein (TIGR00369 family)